MKTALPRECRQCSSLLALYLPFFNTQFLVIEHYGPRIRTELRHAGVQRINAKKVGQGFARHYEYAAFILCQKIFAIRTEKKTVKVTSQRRLKRNLVQQSRQVLFPGHPLGSDDGLLPLRKV